LCALRRGDACAHLCARALRHRHRRAKNPRRRPAAVPRRAARPGTLMDLSRLESGQVIDGFRLEAPLNPGGMANLWRVSHPDHAMPLVMKLPFIRPGENPVAIIGFEVEGMILPRLTGEHAPRFVKSGDFSNPYIVMEFIAGTPLKARLDETPLPAAEVAAMGAKIAVAL